MSENPFTSPEALDEPHIASSSEAVDAEKVYQVAKRQRYLNLGILAYIILIVFRMIAASAASPEDGQTLGLIGMIYIVCALAVFVLVITSLFSLARCLHNTAAAIVFTLIGLIPLLGLFAFLGVSNTATKFLREHGIQVGLLGADLSQFNCG